ncbi:glycosyltransferase family 4 protein [Tatumella sp. JGM130]|uniref:glycosyltransferase family 4 protein n=1 Tax=Tatumella sp. JGM130 TaxID=2799797 RepID=UPI001BB023A9|nr:glycosyltransferase family 4 protein [Tatumella sp. JGM130]MBS0894954.1 glycosyltransferase family 4 protein [Tatumella sp. JGM130]
MKRIAFVIDDISHKGGTERVLSNLIDSLSATHKITVCSINEGGGYGYLRKTENVRFANGINRFFKIINIISFLKEEDFDSVIIISMGRLSFEINPLLKIFRCRSKIISCDHVAIESFSLPLRVMKMISYTFPDKIIVLTESDRDYIKTKNPFVNEIRTVRNSSPFSKVNLPISELMYAREKSVLAVGRLTEQKNFKVLIKMWASLPEEIKSHWVLKIAGDGELKEDLQNQISYHDLEGKVILLGNVNDIIDEYKKASFLCMTSLYEGLPMTLIEAKDFGLPVISFDCKTGPKEIIRDDGFLIDCFNEGEYIDSMIKLMTSENIRYEMSTNALKNRIFYSEDKITSEWNSFI